jgi:hypothetical protein
MIIVKAGDYPEFGAMVDSGFENGCGMNPVTEN